MNHHQLQQQANHWLEQQKSPLNKSQQQAFLTWLNTSPDHQVAYQQSQQINQLLTQFTDTNFDEDQATPSENISKLAIPARTSPFASIWTMAACVAILMLSITSYQLWPDAQQADFHAQYKSTRGEQVDFSLPDGSKLSLDAQTKIALDFDSNQRLSQLSKGRALFDVAKNPQRPFIINTDRAKITVLGTRFSVDNKKNSTRISVEHGRVKVQSKQHSQHLIELVQGQQAVFSDLGMDVQNMNPQLVDAWRNGRLVFNNVPLSEVCAEFNRYHDTNFEFTEHSVSNMMISGTFTASELDNFLNLLPHVLPIKVKNLNNHVVISKV